MFSSDVRINTNGPILQSAKSYELSAFGTRFKIKKTKGKYKKHHHHHHTGTIQLQLAKAYHVEGEIVYGQVVVQGTSFCPIGNIFLKAEGYEKAEWETERTVWEGEGENRKSRTVIDKHEGARDFFKLKFGLGYVAGLQAGQSMIFPFAFQLPGDLTGTFYDKRHAFGRLFKGKVKFIMKVKCDGNKDLTYKIPMVIQQKPSAIQVQKWVNHSATVMLLCCIPRGLVTMRAMFERNFYTPGETANIVVDCKNDSKSDVQKLNMKLIQVTTLTSKHRTAHTDRRVVAETHYPGVPSGQKVENKLMPLPIPLSIGTTTSGKHVQCHYELHVESAIDYAPDIELTIPVSIFYPMMQQPGLGYNPPPQQQGYPPSAVAPGGGGGGGGYAPASSQQQHQYSQPQQQQYQLPYPLPQQQPPQQQPQQYQPQQGQGYVPPNQQQHSGYSTFK